MGVPRPLVPMEYCSSDGSSTSTRVSSAVVAASYTLRLVDIVVLGVDGRAWSKGEKLLFSIVNYYSVV